MSLNQLYLDKPKNIPLIRVNDLKIDGEIIYENDQGIPISSLESSGTTGILVDNGLDVFVDNFVPSGSNIYNINGTLNSNRILFGGFNNLTFTDINQLELNASSLLLPSLPLSNENFILCQDVSGVLYRRLDTSLQRTAFALSNNSNIPLSSQDFRNVLIGCENCTIPSLTNTESVIIGSVNSSIDDESSSSSIISSNLSVIDNLAINGNISSSNNSLLSSGARNQISSCDNCTLDSCSETSIIGSQDCSISNCDNCVILASSSLTANNQNDLIFGGNALDGITWNINTNTGIANFEEVNANISINNLTNGTNGQIIENVLGVNTWVSRYGDDSYHEIRTPQVITTTLQILDFDGSINFQVDEGKRVVFDFLVYMTQINPGSTSNTSVLFEAEDLNLGSVIKNLEQSYNLDINSFQTLHFRFAYTGVVGGSNIRLKMQMVLAGTSITLQSNSSLHITRVN